MLAEAFRRKHEEMPLGWLGVIGLMNVQFAIREDTIYVLSAPALRSIDGGRTWETLSGAHGDFHDLWVDPDDAQHLVIGNDGGGSVSMNGATAATIWAWACALISNAVTKAGVSGLSGDL